MNDAVAELERQWAWQRERRLLSWPEKVRRVEGIRESIVELRRDRKRVTASPKDRGGQPGRRMEDNENAFLGGIKMSEQEKK